MKFLRLTLAGFLALASLACAAQTLVERLYIVRTDSTVFDPYSGMTHTCLLLYPDGRYRFERTFQSNQGGNTDAKIYLDTLPDADLKALEVILDDNQFQQIQTDPPHGGIVQNMDTLSVSVPREHKMQSFDFNNTNERKPFEKTLKPFLDSLKKIEKRKVAVAKNEKSDNCTPPRVMYRSTFAPGTNPNPNNDPNQ